MDDVTVTGGHMTKSSRMMMGSKLNLEWLSKTRVGLNTRYRWTGKMMGISMDFTVQVTKWIPGREKVWETIGPAKLVIYSWYRMNLLVSQLPEGSKAALSITYEKPQGPFNKILCFLFADWYCAWCLKQMLADAKKAITTRNFSSAHVHG
jgi:hypothetical protein